MKIVRGYTIDGQLLVQGHTDLVAKVGDIVKLYLDTVADPGFPKFIRAIVEHPIVVKNCGTRTSYSFAYDESLLNGALTRLRHEDIVDVLVYSTQGRSVYESYLLTTNDEPPLSESAWTATVLRGPQGPTGLTGPQGPTGATGPSGATETTSSILDKIKGIVADPTKIGAEYLPDSLSGTVAPVAPKLTVNGTQLFNGDYFQYGSSLGRPVYLKSTRKVSWVGDRWLAQSTSAPIPGGLASYDNVSDPSLATSWVRTGTEDTGGPYVVPVMIRINGVLAYYVGQPYLNTATGQRYHWDGLTWASDVDATLIDGSANPVSGNAVFDALQLKAPLISPAITGTMSVNSSQWNGSTFTGNQGFSGNVVIGGSLTVDMAITSNSDITATGSVIGTTLRSTTIQAPTDGGVVVKNSAGTNLMRVGKFDATTGLSSGVATGFGTIASGEASHAEGIITLASGNYSHAEGSTTTASGVYSHAEGSGTTASGSSSHAEGSGFTTASGNSSHAEGRNSIASGQFSHAAGDTSTASGDYSHASGRRAKATHQGSRVLSDSQDADVNSSAINECTFRFAGGYRFLGGGAAFASTTRPTSAGTGAPSAGSLVTANDVIDESVWNLYRNPTSNTKLVTSAANNGVVTVNPWGTTISVGNTNMSARPVYCRGDIATDGNQTISSAVNVRTAMLFSYFHSRYYDGAANLEKIKLRYIVGGDSGLTPRYGNENALVVPGWGFEVFWSTVNSRFEIKLFACDATAGTYTQSATPAVFPTPNGMTYNIVIERVSGVVNLYMSSGSPITATPRTPLLTLAAPITATTYGTQNFQSWAVVSESGLLTTNAVGLSLSDTKTNIF